LGKGKILRSDIVVNLVVISLRIEGRIDVGEIDRFIFDVPTQDLEVIAVIEKVLDGGLLFGTPQNIRENCSLIG
jgi:hypothetical protein